MGDEVTKARESGRRGGRRGMREGGNRAKGGVQREDGEKRKGRRESLPRMF